MYVIVAALGRFPWVVARHLSAWMPVTRAGRLGDVREDGRAPEDDHVAELLVPVEGTDGAGVPVDEDGVPADGVGA